MKRERIAVFLCCEPRARVVTSYHRFVDEGQSSSIFSYERRRDLSNRAYPARLKTRLRALSRITVFSRVLQPSDEIVAGLESLPPSVEPMAPFLDLRRSFGRATQVAAFSRYADVAPAPRIMRSARELCELARWDPLILWATAMPLEIEREVLTNLASDRNDRSVASMLGVFERGSLAVALPIDDDCGLGYAIYSRRDITTTARTVWRRWARTHGVELFEGSHPDRVFVNLRDPRKKVPRGVQRLV